MPQSETRERTDDAQRETSKPAQIITDFTDLYPRPITATRWRVLNLASRPAPTANLVDLDAMTCTCADHTYRRDPDEDHAVCKHLATVLYESGRWLNSEVVASTSLSGNVESTPSETAETDAEPTDTDTTPTDNRDKERIAETLETAVKDAHDEPEKIGVMWDSAAGAFAVTQDGFIDDFDSHRDVVNDLGFSYDPEADAQTLDEGEARETAYRLKKGEA